MLAKELQKHLRSRRPMRRSAHNTATGQWRSKIRDAVSISERPAEVEDRAVPGHWEGDLLLGRHWTQVATVVERSTRYTVLVQLDSREMSEVTAGLRRVMPRLPAEVRKSLTWDRGMELADHKNVTIDTGLAVYFADPRSPWQRGTNERAELERLRAENAELQMQVEVARRVATWFAIGKQHPTLEYLTPQEYELGYRGLNQIAA